MKNIEEFVDKRQKSWCVHCGGWIVDLETNRDHIPSKSLLRAPSPPNLPVMQICSKCNEGFSLDEEYFSVFLECVIIGSTKPKLHKNQKIARTLEKNAKLRAKIEKSKTEYQTIGGEQKLIWNPEEERIKRVVLKNARGHAFYEYGEPMMAKPEHVNLLPFEGMTNKQRSEFENIGAGEVRGWPEVGSRMMTRVITGQDLSDGWVDVQEGKYRYAVIQKGIILIRSVINEYLATEVLWEY